MAVRTGVGKRLWWWGGGDELRARLSTLAYAESGRRDLRLDFLRGLAVSVMVVDHIGGDTILTQLSGGGQFIVSAAEGFVFLSGLVLGMVYGERIVRAGLGDAIRSLIDRTATLYRASVGLGLAFLALYLFTDLQLWFDRAYGLSISDPVEAAVGILTLHYTLHGSDVLVMYTLMLAAAPGTVYLLYRGHATTVLLGSLVIWAIQQRYPSQAELPWNVIASSFPVAAWQLLFVLGMVVGFHRTRVVGWLSSGDAASRLAILLCGVTIYFLARSSDLHWMDPLPEIWFGDAIYGSLFYKVSLGPGRVLASLSVIVLAFTLVNLLWVPLKSVLGWFLLPLGQNSLYVYIVHLFVLVLLYNLAPLVDWVDADAVNLAAQVIGVALVWIMVRTRFLFSFVPR